MRGAAARRRSRGHAAGPRLDTYSECNGAIYHILRGIRDGWKHATLLRRTATSRGITRLRSTSAAHKIKRRRRRRRADLAGTDDGCAIGVEKKLRAHVATSLGTVMKSPFSVTTAPFCGFVCGRSVTKRIFDPSAFFGRIILPPFAHSGAFFASLLEGWMWIAPS